MKIKLRLNISTIHTNEHKYANCGLHVIFWGNRTHADIIGFSNMLQLKNQRSGCKIMCGFSITFVLKEIMTF